MGTIDSWTSIEAILKQRLDLQEIDRRRCAVCGRQGPSLSRCFGCQMVYYCGEEHQAEDWSREHAQKCAQLEWVALGEFIQALPAQAPLPNLGDKWSLPLREINSWKSWFSIRPNIVHLAHNTANVFKNLMHLTDKRQPNYQNAIDGLLAAVTDLLTHALTIGKATVYFGLHPHIRPLVIHVLNGFNKIDLVGNDQSPSNLPARFHELLNMFPDNKGVELVIVIGDDDQDDTDHISTPQAKLKPDRLIITTTGKGRFLDTSEEKRLQRSVADLLVYFNAAQLFSLSNKDLLKSMLTRQRPTLLTFDDEDEFNQATSYLSMKGINVQQAGTNQFSSLVIRQRPSKPNSTYSTNSYQILLNTMTNNGTVERNDENCSLLSRQRPHQSSIGIQHGHTSLQEQQQLNPTLKQVNGKIHIESISSSSSSSHNTQANKNETLRDTTVHIVSTMNTTTPTVQPSVRSNNHIRQPAIAQRRQQQSPPSSASSVITSTAHRETRLTTAPMATTIDSVRNDQKPQPKPRQSLVKPTHQNIESITPHANGSIVQRIKPFFEHPPAISPQEPKPTKQQRQPVSIPYTYQIGNATKATCLDDLLSAKKVYTILSPPPIPPPPPVETYTNERSTTIASPTPVETHYIQRPTITNTSEIPKPVIEHRPDERTIKPSVNKVASPLTIPIEIHHDQRTVMKAAAIIPPAPLSSIENRFAERPVTAVTVDISSTPLQPTENHTEQVAVLPTVDSASSPPPRPPPPPGNNEVIYSEVIKNHERPLPMHHIDLTKMPISPSRSFVIPTKSTNLSIKNPSFNLQRPSRPAATTNTVLYPNRPKPLPSTMAADRISLYSQRSTKQADGGVTIKNLSECIDRVGIVFDEANRPNDAPSAGLTTVDLIREQLTTSSVSRPAGSLLDKLHKSNSSTRLSKSSSRTSMSATMPRSKSQQATRVHDEPPEIPKITPTVPLTTSHSIRRTVGVFLPLTPKNTQEPEQTHTITTAQSPTLVYQNLEPHTSTKTSIAPPVVRTPDYTLKQPTGPVCNGIPKPFRKPTAIIEPSPVVPTPIPVVSEPNYMNLTHQDEHIYTNENGTGLLGSSNSNSYTSKTSSIYSSSEKQNSSTRPETLYAVTNIPSTHQEQSVEYDSFDDELAANDIAKIEKPVPLNDNTDDDSFDDDENQEPIQTLPSKNTSSSFFRSTINRLTRSNKSLERLNNESITNDSVQDANNPSNIIDTKTKKTLRSIKARREAKKTGTLSAAYPGDEDTTSIDSNCSTQTATSLNKAAKSSHHRFRLFRRKIEKEFASDTEAEKQQTEQRRKKWNKKMLNDTANELKTKRLLMMSDEDDDIEENNLSLNPHPSSRSTTHDEPHIYDHIIHEENNNNSLRLGKLSNETHFKSPTVTLDEIRSEIQAEIAARQDVQINNASSTASSSNLTLQKKRSKSVTFLDELLSDDPKQNQSNALRKNDISVKQSATIKRVEKGDARSICGALTGTGPIRGIIKAANNGIIGTTGPVSPSAAASIYLSGTPVDTRCTSPKVHERTQRPLSTYTVGSARFYDGASASSSSTSVPPAPPPSLNHNNNTANQRSMLNTNSRQSASDSVHHKRPTAKVSPFQTKSPNDTSSSSPITNRKQPAFPSTTKKSVQPSLHRNLPMSHDITHVATSSVSDVVGGVSKRLQSNF